MVLWTVDPDGFGQRRRRGRLAHEAFGVAEVSPVQDLLPGRDDVGCATVMHDLGREPSDAGMVVFGVVPSEEIGAEGPGVLDPSKAARELRAILERLELALGVGVV